MEWYYRWFTESKIGDNNMITGDYKLGCQYRDLIIEQIKKELKPSEEDIQLMKDRLNKASSDELERTYEAFERFGVEVIMDNICRRNLVFIDKMEVWNIWNMQID